MKRGDIVVIIISIALILLSSALFFTQRDIGNTVVIKENNKVTYKFSLYEDRVVELKGNTVEIEKGKVRVTSADCKNQICVNHRSISEKNENIICLPNKVIIEIE